VDGAGPAGAEDLFGEGFLLFGAGFSAALQRFWDGDLADLELLGPGPGKRKLQQGNAFPLDIEGAFQTFFEEYFDSTVDGAGPAGAEDLFGEGFLLFGQGFSAALQQIWDNQLADLELLGPGPGK